MTDLPPPVSMDDVASIFRRAVRVSLDWDRLLREKTSVTMHVVRAPAHNSRVYTSWYVSRTEMREVSFDETTARPLRLDQLADSIDALDDRRVALMEKIASSHRRTPAPPLLLGYALPGDGILLLDGNHRWGAVAVHHLSASALALVIHGPMDAAVLPDLGPWTQQDL